MLGIYVGEIKIKNKYIMHPIFMERKELEWGFVKVEGNLCWLTGYYSFYFLHNASLSC